MSGRCLCSGSIYCTRGLTYTVFVHALDVSVCLPRVRKQGAAKFCGMGCGLMLLNNIPQTANSLGGGQAEPALFVMIMSTT